MTALGFAAAALGVIITAATSFLLAYHQMSRSGARLRADLELLDKARAMKIDQTLIDALNVRIEHMVALHTASSQRWAGTLSKAEARRLRTHKPR